jgi:hypothetical protein
MAKIRVYHASGFFMGKIPPSKGRPKGAKNKIQADLRKRILDVEVSLRAKGLGLGQWAAKNPDSFYTTLYAKVIPKEIDARIHGDISITVISGIDREPNSDS